MSRTRSISKQDVYTINHPIQNYFSNRNLGHLLFWPEFGRIQNAVEVSLTMSVWIEKGDILKLKVVLVLSRDDLDGERPGWISTVGDGFL